MDVSPEIILLVIAGCLGGFISGLLGVGGGIIFVPILDYFLTKQGIRGHDLVVYTLANSFFAILVSGVTGSFGAIRAKEINYTHLFSVAFSAIAAVLLTSYLISIGNWYTPLFFKLMFCGMLLFTLFKTLIHIEADGTNETLNLKRGIVIGLVTGVFSALSGLGGGMIMILLFMMLGNLTIKKASTLSLAVIPLLALPNVIYYAFSQPQTEMTGSTGYLVWPLIIPLIIGVIITVKAGLVVAKMLSPKSIKIIFACFIIVTIIKTISSIV